MSDTEYTPTTSETLADFLRLADYGPDGDGGAMALADSILNSDWLKAYTAGVEARVREECAEAEVLVEGSYFKSADLPGVLGTHMRLAGELTRDLKQAHLAITELRPVRDADTETLSDSQWADYFEHADSVVGGKSTWTSAELAQLFRGPRPFGIAAAIRGGSHE